MPVTITLKNIPDAVYEQLKVAAEVHHRSLNSEVIACLETILLPVKKSPMERLARARILRSQFEFKGITAVDIDDFKSQGRT
ncbi:MAG: FitA-like ribbon-helix-helix domain-containing protein [Prochlorotrichaceae cyanobacterium]|jgi:plasmid stability protein